MSEPQNKRVAVFVDGQNLYHTVKKAFGYEYPNYDIKKLVTLICNRNDWNVAKIYFYTGIPSLRENSRWNYFWSAKLSSMANQGIKVFSRPLRWGKEKGIDVQITLDATRGAAENEYDVVVIFSQDQDFTGVAEEIRYIARKYQRWIKIASAFPISDIYLNKRGINNTDWIYISKEIYDQCIDPKIYLENKVMQ